VAVASIVVVYVPQFAPCVCHKPSTCPSSPLGVTAVSPTMRGGYGRSRSAAHV